jgi:hypothetical protein
MGVCPYVPLSTTLCGRLWMAGLRHGRPSTSMQRASQRPWPRAPTSVASTASAGWRLSRGRRHWAATPHGCRAAPAPAAQGRDIPRRSQGCSVGTVPWRRRSTTAMMGVLGRLDAWQAEDLAAASPGRR